MKIFFDTEFIEDGKTIELISIGMVREDGSQYYAQNKDCDLNRANDWVKENVFPSLSMGYAWYPKLTIARDIKEFVGTNPEFWAYYADYDWVALCQLYGTMMDLPQGWPMFCLDLKQELWRIGNPKFDAPKNEHNAQIDALWNRDLYQFIASHKANAPEEAR